MRGRDRWRMGPERPPPEAMQRIRAESRHEVDLRDAGCRFVLRDEQVGRDEVQHPEERGLVHRTERRDGLRR